MSNVALAETRPYSNVVSDKPDEPLPVDIQALEREARDHHDSELRQSRLLLEFCGSELGRHPRRLELILNFISRFPRSSAARSPTVHVDPIEDAEAFKAIEALWLQLRDQHTTDPELAIGHAALVANEDPSRSTEILRAAITLLPSNADLWTELGRVTSEPLERFEALQKARALGSSQPNLLVWMGRSAVEAGRTDDVFEIGCELMARANQTRATIHSPIPWTDTGSSAWTRIRGALENSRDRQEQISSLSQYANDLHWAHTFLGLVATERGQLVEAGQHLLSSSSIWGEPRLSSYGPSLLLARKLCEAGMWKNVEGFLTACMDFWDDEIVEDWLQDVRDERIPDFDDATD